MLKDLSSTQRALADCMSELSEHAYSAAWTENLEHALWRAVVEGPFRYGRLEIELEHVERLKSLSSNCGGWVVFDDVREEVFLPLQDWNGVYDSTRAL